MPDFTRWMNWDEESNLEDWLDDANRAGGVAFMIGHRGVSVVLVRDGAPLAAQTVLLVPASGSRSSTPEAAGGAGIAGTDNVYLIGTSGHGDMADLDVQRGDRFALAGVVYEITYVDRTMIGKVEARGESAE